MELVNYSIGKKLQEKGYPHGYNRFGYRPIYSDECTIKYLWDIGAYEEDYYGENIPCPTIDEVLEWLRKEKKLHIIAEISDSGWYYTIYPNIRWENGKLTSDKYIMSFKHKESYAQAVLAGIEYALDNLI